MYKCLYSACFRPAFSLLWFDKQPQQKQQEEEQAKWALEKKMMIKSRKKFVKLLNVLSSFNPTLIPPSPSIDTILASTK